MTSRRTLGSAMEMTPEKLAFIHGESKSPTSETAIATAPANEKTIDLEIAAQQPVNDRELATRTPRRSSRRSHQDLPDAGQVLDRVLVPVTIRLPHRMSQALKRAYLEQKLNHAKPDTQQDIVEEALGNWLSHRGFLD